MTRAFPSPMPRPFFLLSVNPLLVLDLHYQVVSIELVSDVDHDVRDLPGRRGGDVGLHLHGAQGGDGLPLGYHVANLDLEAYDHPGHGAAHVPGIGGLLPPSSGHILALVGDRGEPALPVHVENDVAGTILVHLAHRGQLDEGLVPKAEIDLGLVPLLKGVEEQVGGEGTDVPINGGEVLKVDEDIGVECVR